MTSTVIMEAVREALRKADAEDHGNAAKNCSKNIVPSPLTSLLNSAYVALLAEHNHAAESRREPAA